MLRLVFMGTPLFSVPTLAAIIGAGHDIAAVYCQPPRPAGRGLSETKSPVQAYAEASNLRVHTPRSLKSADAQSIFAAHQADAAVVIAYGLLLPQAVLDAPRLGCFNMHASRLPRWRGAAPIQRAIMAGDTETAAMVMRMEAGLDTGPVCIGECVPIASQITAGDLHDVLANRGAALIVQALAALERGSLTATPQDDFGITYATKIEKSETRINFTRSAADVHNHIRGLAPFPGAWFEAQVDGKTERIKVLRCERAEGQGAPGVVLDDRLTIACGTGAVRPLLIQRAGKNAMPVADVLRGVPLPAGTMMK